MGYKLKYDFLEIRGYLKWSIVMEFILIDNL